MSEVTELGHGHSPAAWTAVVIMLLGFTGGVIAFYFSLSGIVWACAAGASAASASRAGGAASAAASTTSNPRSAFRSAASARAPATRSSSTTQWTCLGTYLGPLTP